MVHSLVYSLQARCYSVSLTSTASAIVMPAGGLVSSGTGRSRSKASNLNSSVLKSGIQADRAAKGFSM